jgi:hypothetical protein
MWSCFESVVDEGMGPGARRLFVILKPVCSHLAIIEDRPFKVSLDGCIATGRQVSSPHSFVVRMAGCLSGMSDSQFTSRVQR